MGWFGRKKEQQQALSVVEPVVIEMPTVKPDELEDMIRVTYKEKLELEAKLADAQAQLEQAKEQNTKRKAAEEFSRQTEQERQRLDKKVERTEQQVAELSTKLRQEESKVTTRDIKIRNLEEKLNELETALSENEDHCKQVNQTECITQLKQRVNSMTGGWSKARVLELLESFLADPSASDAYDVEDAYGYEDYEGYPTDGEEPEAEVE